MNMKEYKCKNMLHYHAFTSTSQYYFRKPNTYIFK
jgi:hypothetical protein